MADSEIKKIVEAIEVRMAALGFTTTNEVFDFDRVPNSIIDKAYRIEVKLAGNSYGMDFLANPKDDIAIWIAYKEKRNVRTVWKAALDDRQAIEKDLVKAAGILSLSSDPLLTMDKDASDQKYLSNYLISKLAFTVDYLVTL